MFDYKRFYEAYSCASDDKKDDLLEQLKVVIYFNFQAFFTFHDFDPTEFFAYAFPKLKSIVKAYHGDSNEFFTYLKKSLEENIRLFRKLMQR